MSARAIAISLAACLGLAVSTALLLDWSLEKAIILAPIIVVVAGAAGVPVRALGEGHRESASAAAGPWRLGCLTGADDGSRPCRQAHRV